MPSNSAQNSNQAQAHVQVGNEVESTLHSATQASAARFIDMLREAYPEIDRQDLAEQKKLHDILEQQVASFSLVEHDTQEQSPQDLQRDPQSSLHATLSMIARIKSLNTHSRKDIKHVLIQMFDITRASPGFIWTAYDQQWSQNAIYDAKSNSVRFVAASPAATLNLVCRAILDNERYPHETLDGKTAIENESLRIDSLFRCILEL